MVFPLPAPVSLSFTTFTHVSFNDAVSNTVCIASKRIYNDLGRNTELKEAVVARGGKLKEGERKKKEGK
jgi:hypothetical protein